MSALRTDYLVHGVSALALWHSPTYLQGGDGCVQRDSHQMPPVHSTVVLLPAAVATCTLHPQPPPVSGPFATPFALRAFCFLQFLDVLPALRASHCCLLPLTLLLQGLIDGKPIAIEVQFVRSYPEDSTSYEGTDTKVMHHPAASM